MGKSIDEAVLEVEEESSSVDTVSDACDVKVEKRPMFVTRMIVAPEQVTKDHENGVILCCKRILWPWYRHRLSG